MAVYGVVIPFNNTASSFLLERDFFQEGDLLNQTEAEMLDETAIDCLGGSDLDIGGQSSLRREAYCRRKNEALAKASVVMSIPYIISAVSAPVFGMIIDQYGYAAAASTAACVLLALVHVLLRYTSSASIPAAWLMVGQGVGYSLYAAALWPCIPTSVSADQVGLAYGIATSALNIGLTVFPLIAATLYDLNGQRYIPAVENFYICLATFGFAAGCCLNFADRAQGGALNRASGRGLCTGCTGPWIYM
jgi:MFS family permease